MLFRHKKFALVGRMVIVDSVVLLDMVVTVVSVKFVRMDVIQQVEAS